MSNYIHYRNINSNHLARSIIVSRSNYPPTWMNTELFQRNSWPTPATRTYEAIVSRDFAQYYWLQDSPKREIMVNSVARELHHEGGGRIYTRLSSNGDILVRQSVDEFKRIIMKRLLNLRYPTEEVTHADYYDSLFSPFTEGERVLVSSRSTLVYEGVFQFVSVINSDHCYIQFDSRSHIISWDINLVEHINISDVPNRRLTRQMARAQQTTGTVAVAAGASRGQSRQRRLDHGSDTDTISDDSLDEVAIDNSFPQGGEGVARARNNNQEEQGSNNSLDQGGEGVARARNNNHDMIETFNAGTGNIMLDNDFFIPGGTSYENLFNRYGDGTENKTVLSVKWLTKQGFTTNPKKDEICVICFEKMTENEVVYDIKCYGTLKHPLHTHCAQKCISERQTKCPVCRCLWEE